MARDIKFLVDDVKKAVAAGGQSASVLIMNSLSQRGPHWLGEFSSAWSSVSGRTKRGSRPRQFEGPKFQYKMSDVKKAIIPKNVKGTHNLYTILNESPHAPIALDLIPWVPGDFELPYGNLNDSRFVYGIRPGGGKRGELRSIGSRLDPNLTNRRTAPLDWYPTYASGGAFAKDFKAGMRSGLKLVSRNPGRA